MYRTNNFGWKLTHILCILAHLGLLGGGAIAYVYNKMGRYNSIAQWNALNAMNTGPCHAGPDFVRHSDLQLVLMGNVATSAMFDVFDVALHTLSLTCLALVGFPSAPPSPRTRSVPVCWSVMLTKYPANREHLDWLSTPVSSSSFWPPKPPTPN